MDVRDQPGAADSADGADGAEPALPRSFLACLPVVWSQVLFPGEPSTPGAWRWRPFLLVVIIPGLLLYPWLSFYLFEPDEGRYAQVPREMLERGDWIVPHLQGEPYPDKPPLFYWLVMIAYQLLGVHDWVARLVPALAIHGCILMTYLFGRRSLGDRPALWGALALTLAPAFISMGRLLLLDGVLAFLVTLSLFAAWESLRPPLSHSPTLPLSHPPTLHWPCWLLSAAACGLGVLTKGPVSLLLLVPPLWLHRRLAGGGARISATAVLAFVGVIFLVVLPWYVAVCVRLPEFAGHFLWEHNVVRFLMPFAHKQPVWFYLPILLVGFVPATLLLVPWLRFLTSGRQEERSCRSAALGFVLLAGGWCVLFFSLSDCKLPTYILPAYPFLALGFGCFLAHSRWSVSRTAPVAATVALGLLLLGHGLAVPWLARVRSPMNRPDEVHAVCADPAVPVVCYPRPLDSVAFYLGRSDFKSYRSKQTPLLLQDLDKHPRTVVLFSHRHSLEALRQVLPPHLHLTGATTLGLCDMAVVEHRPVSLYSASSRP